MKKLILVLAFTTLMLNSYSQLNIGVHAGDITSFTYRGTGGKETNQLESFSPSASIFVGYTLKYFATPFLSVGIISTKEHNAGTHENMPLSVGIRGNIIKNKISPIYQASIGLNSSTIDRGKYGGVAKYKSSNLISQLGVGLSYTFNSKFIGELLFSTSFSSQDDKLISGTYNLKYWYTSPSIGIVYKFRKKSNKN